ncbi:MAG: UpxY family transcription antiterminator [Saprospiraceae bacterium]
MSSVINHLHETDPRWFAVHTRSKSEKFVHRMLAKKGIHCYLPLQKLMRRYVRSTRMVEIPLINCYVFVHITKQHYLPILETENVAGFVKLNKDLRAIPDAEIEIMRRVTLEKGLDLELIPGSFTEGEPVEITAGNLIGMKGRIVKTEGTRKFQIELLTLGYSLLLSLDAAYLGKLEKDLD